jgi:NADPH:quinone reductase-like Zn-dependent oxidoreductase
MLNVQVPRECAEWTPNEAASIVSTFGTVFQGAIKTAGLPADADAGSGGGTARKRVLVTGAGGGVGSAAVQLLSAGGHHVVAVTASPSKRAYIQGLDRHHLSSDGGGSVVVVECSRAMPDFSKAVLKEPGGGAVDMVLENVGAPTMAHSLRCLRSGGQLVLIGNVTNATFPLPLGLCIVKSLSVIGTDSCEAAEVARLMVWMQARGLKPHVDRVLPLREAAVAHGLVEHSAVEGRVVLAVSGDGASWDTGALPHLE